MNVVGHELRNGEVLLTTSGFRDWQYLEFPVDAYFHQMPHSKAGTWQAVSVTETLDACFESADMVVSRLRKEM